MQAGLVATYFSRTMSERTKTKLPKLRDISRNGENAPDVMMNRLQGGLASGLLLKRPTVSVVYAISRPRSDAQNGKQGGWLAMQSHGGAVGRVCKDMQFLRFTGEQAMSMARRRSRRLFQRKWCRGKKKKRTS